VHFQAVSPYIWHIGLDRSQIVAKESAPILESIHFASERERHPTSAT